MICVAALRVILLFPLRPAPATMPATENSMAFYLKTETATPKTHTRQFSCGSKNAYRLLRVENPGLRFYRAPLGKWIHRDPIEEQGGINLYGFTTNSPISHADPIGLRCNIEVLFGHGAAQDVAENWLLEESVKWVAKLDDSDGLSLFGCKTTQVKSLLTGKTVADSQAKLGKVLTPGDWSDDVGDNTAADKAHWSTMVAGLEGRKKSLCSATKGNCCKNVWVTFHCQDKPEIMDNAKKISGIKANNFVKDLKKGETFCGKKWRWNCVSGGPGGYWELWDPSWAMPDN